MFFIIVSTASTINKAGAKDVGQLDLAGIAQVLRPLAGDAAYLLFTLGIVGIGLLAIPVPAGSAAYALSEVFGWKQGLDKKFHEAKGFYITIILATMVGLGLVFVGVDPVAALYYSAVIKAGQERDPEDLEGSTPRPCRNAQRPAQQRPAGIPQKMRLLCRRNVAGGKGTGDRTDRRKCKA